MVLIADEIRDGFHLIVEVCRKASSVLVTYASMSQVSVCLLTR